MIIVSQDKKALVNFNNVVSIVITNKKKVKELLFVHFQSKGVTI